MPVHASEYFYIERPRLGFNLSYEYEKDIHRGRSTDRENHNSTYIESLDIESEGWVYHPALLIYSLLLSPGWEQMREKSDLNSSTNTATSNSFLQGYNANVTVLPYKPYTLMIRGSRSESLLRSNFSGRTRDVRNLFGATFFLKDVVLPITVSYNHEESKRRGVFTSDEDRDEITALIRNSSIIGRTTLTTSYRDNTQKSEGTTINIRQQNVALQNMLLLSKQHVVSLTSSLNYDETLGSNADSTTYTVQEYLNWNHRKNLNTRYSFRYKDDDHFDKITLTPSRKQTIIGSFKLFHLLYENLVTNIATHVTQNQNSGNEEVLYEAGVNFDYTRKIPWGLLKLNVGEKARITDVKFNSDYSVVFDESINLFTTMSILLEHEFIDVNTIVVTDNTGLTAYFENIDFTISKIGTLTRIKCISGAKLDIDLNCTNGAPVLIDYQYKSKFPVDVLQVDQFYGISLNLWSKLNMYYRFTNIEEKSLRGSNPNQPLVRSRTHTVGADYYADWSKTSFEYEDDQSTILPKRKVHAGETITLRPRQDIFLNFSLNYYKTDFVSIAESEKVSSIEANLQKLIRNWGKFTVEGLYSKSDGSLDRTTDFGLSLDLDWFYRIYQGTITYSFLDTKAHETGEDRQNHYFLFEVKRSIF